MRNTSESWPAAGGGATLSWRLRWTAHTHKDTRKTNCPGHSNDDDRGKAHAATGACNDVGTHRGPGRRKNRHSSTWAGPPRTLAPCSAPGSCTGGPALCRRSRCTPRTPCLQLAQHTPEAGAAELLRKPRLRSTMVLGLSKRETQPSPWVQLQGSLQRATGWLATENAPRNEASIVVDVAGVILGLARSCCVESTAQGACAPPERDCTCS